MITQASHILGKKHLLITGGSASKRRSFVSDLITELNEEVFRFPSGMKNIDVYYDFVKRNKLFEPWYEANSYNPHQIVDFHRDWIAENRGCFVMEEFDQIEERGRLELLRMYIELIDQRKKGDKHIHLIISQENENGLFEKLAPLIPVREHQRRTALQIVEQNMRVFDISG